MNFGWQAMSAFNIGDRVRAKLSIYQEADDYAPGGYLCAKNDLLIVRDVRASSFGWPYAVSHENVTDRSFAVAGDEIELDATRKAGASDQGERNE